MIHFRKAAALAIGSLIFTATITESTELAEITNDPKASTVRIRSGDKHGSGVIVRENDGIYWVVTNDHVLTNGTEHCIESAGGGFYQGFHLPMINDKVDLALLWFKSERGIEPVAHFASSPAAVIEESIQIVLATGFPANQRYEERAGLTVPLLKKPLEGGYNLTYTSDIDKGMSGGGIFNLNNELIGINAAHQEALWDATWTYQSGEPVAASLNKKLDLVAIGLNIISIDKALKAIAIPSSEMIEDAEEADICLKAG